MSRNSNLRTALVALLISAAVCACGGGGNDDGGGGGGRGGGSGDALIWGAGTWGSDEFSATP